MNLLKGLKNLIKNPKNFFKKWKEGYTKLTPFDYIKAKLMGHRIMIVGVVVGAVGMIIEQFYYMLILFAGMLWLQVYEHRRAKIQMDALVKMEKQLGGVQ